MKNTAQKLYLLLRKQVSREFGSKCGEYDFGCVVCNAHRVVDDLKPLIELLYALDRKKPMHSHRKSPIPSS